MNTPSPAVGVTDWRGFSFFWWIDLSPPVFGHADAPAAHRVKDNRRNAAKRKE
jgi:hypothetical protein